MTCSVTSFSDVVARPMGASTNAGSKLPVFDRDLDGSQSRSVQPQSSPVSRSKSASSFRRTASSSATRIFIDVPSGELDGERGANTRLGGRFDRTAVARDDVLRER